MNLVRLLVSKDSTNKVCWCVYNDHDRNPTRQGPVQYAIIATQMVFVALSVSLGHVGLP